MLYRAHKLRVLLTMVQKQCVKCGQAFSVKDLAKSRRTLCVSCKAQAKNAWIETHRDTVCQHNRRSYWKLHERRLADQRTANRRIKRLVIEAYGGKCECCGETILEFLTIDHINGGGTKARLAVASSGGFYRFLKKENFPKALELRVLCWNCNMALGHFGYCPHTEGSRIPNAV